MDGKPVWKAEGRMDMGLQVRVWGVRGSGPECGPEYQEYGGNTSCVTVHTKDKTVILDAGTGIGNFDRSFKRQMEGKAQTSGSSAQSFPYGSSDGAVWLFLPF